MARHYSTGDFFRQMPNALLARYFQGRELFAHRSQGVGGRREPSQSWYPATLKAGGTA